jgi:hypothetical protein
MLNKTSKRLITGLGAAAILVGALSVPGLASAQPRGYYDRYHHYHYYRCVRHSANNGAATGAVVGGATVGLLSHSVAGGLIGAGVGALAGHQIAKENGKRNC